MIRLLIIALPWLFGCWLLWQKGRRSWSVCSLLLGVIVLFLVIFGSELFDMRALSGFSAIAMLGLAFVTLIAGLFGGERDG